ncbi:hypothetical protein R1flu_023286 [Riccia fluitans]|uniref:Uncharacterized protein n=1 Tax=Riccia fluitans TaxID=41844 RepID=A0ABD1XS49_9MARC
MVLENGQNVEQNSVLTMFVDHLCNTWETKDRVVLGLVQFPESVQDGGDKNGIQCEDVSNGPDVVNGAVIVHPLHALWFLDDKIANLHSRLLHSSLKFGKFKNGAS